MTEQQALPDGELSLPSTSISVEARMDALSKNMARITAQFAHLTGAIEAESVDFDFVEDPRQIEADVSSVFDPADSYLKNQSVKASLRLSCRMMIFTRIQKIVAHRLLQGLPSE
jgi:hypothetical protein